MKRFAAGIVLLLAAAAAHAQFRTFPDAPHAGEEVVIQFSGNGCGPMTNPSVALAGNVVTVTVTEAEACFATQPPGATFVTVATRFFAPGTYQVHQRVVNRFNANASTGQVGTVTVLGSAAPTRPAVSLNGLWYVPEEAGRGLNIIEGESGRLFLIWFTFQPGTPGTRTGATWYVASTTNWVTPNQARGPFFSAAGAADRLEQPGFDPASVLLTPLGIATLTVNGPDSVTFALDGFNGISNLGVSRNLTRFRF